MDNINCWHISPHLEFIHSFSSKKKKKKKKTPNLVPLFCTEDFFSPIETENFQLRNSSEFALVSLLALRDAVVGVVRRQNPRTWRMEKKPGACL